MVQVGVLLDPEPAGLGEWLTDAAAFDAAGADALWLEPGQEYDILALTAALAAVTFRARLVVPLPAAPERMLGTIRLLSRDRLAEAEEGWERVPVPDGRAAWRATCADAAERGVAGLVVPADPRLLDLLRNPDDPGERHDLHLAQG